jgi:hypothetical protein
VAAEPSSAGPSPEPSSEPSASPVSPPIVPSDSPSPVAPSTVTLPIEAAARLLEMDGARVDFVVERWKGAEPSEILITAHGVTDPAADRGDMTYDLSGMFAIPGAPIESPDSYEVVELRWDARDLYVSFPLDPGGNGWVRMLRTDTTVSGGIVGRLHQEVRGLVALVAGAAPASVEPLSDMALDGAAAKRFLVSIPLADAVAEGVPGDAPDVDTIRRTYGVEAIPVEVWLVGDELRQIGYEFEREKALYGGPDRTSVRYNWELDSSIEIEIPPPGPIEEG